MSVKDSQNEQYLFCKKRKNHPKEDPELCRECELNKKCQPYQEHIQPSLPWVKADEKTSTNNEVKRIDPGEITAICSRCRHYHGNTRCEAYPDKIPTEILLGYVSHTRPYKGDQGIRFEAAI